MKQLFAVFFVVSGLSLSGFSAFPISQIGCQNPDVSDFDITALFSHTNRDELDNAVTAGAHTQHSGAHNLIRFDFLKNGDDFDIFFGGFEGVLYRYNSQNQQVTSIKDLNTIQGSVGSIYKSGDHGLTGIAFHPNFENNRWIFLFYTPKITSGNRVLRLSRFELTPAYQLQNEKILLSMEASTTDQWHSGGDMYFTAHGDLFLQVGDNVGQDAGNSSKTQNAAWTSGSTVSLIGGIVRIHPDSSSDGYSIPKGNFGEHFAATMGVDYANPTKVLPEIYAKGQRSNFTSTGHPTKKIHIWGEVNTGSAHDEINLIHEPVYGGWPHFQGNASSSRTGGSNSRYSHGINDVPELNSTTINTSWIGNAVTELPKVYPADIVVGGTYNEAMAHALYYYGRGDSIWHGRTFPPNFHETFLINGYSKNNPRIIPVQVTGGVPTATVQNSSYDVKNLFTNNGAKLGNAFKHVIEAKYGPDGALYVLSRALNGFYDNNPNNRPSLMTRVDYTGDCHSEALFNLNKASITTAADSSRDASRYRPGFFDASLYDADYVSIDPKQQAFYSLKVGSDLEANVYDIQGKKVSAFQAKVHSATQATVWNGVLSNGQRANSGLYFVQYLDSKGKVLFSQKQAWN